jgi:hypothetical protein
MCVSPNFTKGGSNSLQTSIFNGHLGSNEQPFRGNEVGDELPGITGSICLRFFSLSAGAGGSDSKSALV